MALAVPLDIVLRPVAGGGDLTCTTAVVAPIPADPDSATATCDLHDVPIGVYEAIATVRGRYFTGGGSGSVTVLSGSGGFANGGGTLRIEDGTRLNFGFTAKALKSGQLQGSVLVVYHRSDGTWVLKSNALGSLQQRKTSLGFWTASVTGKATLAGPETLPCGQKKCGNYTFRIYTEDRRDPGQGVDRFWVQVKDPAGAVIGTLSMPAPEATGAAAITSGEVQLRAQPGAK